MRISDWSSDVCSSDLDWDEDLIAECHRRDSGKSFRSVYGRMRWEDVAPTMTTLCYGFGNGRFGHPEQDRAISLREASLFQTFPKRSEEHTSELQSLMRISYAVFCLKKKNNRH